MALPRTDNSLPTLYALRDGALAGITRLDLPGLGLTEVPPEVFALADTLEVLNLSDNLLTSLPDNLSRLHRLKVIFCSGNPFICLPEVLGDCAGLDMVGFRACGMQFIPAAALPPRLRWLTLTDNALSNLPPELGERPALQKLMLAGNRLEALPDSLLQLSQLELLRLSANRLTQVPPWLSSLPRLAWLALSGNPLGWGQRKSAHSLPEVGWTDLLLEDLLGEGASGHIHRVHLQGQPPLALKLFKGQMTSDGLPEHEMAASVLAGPHPNLCTPVATVSHHPQGHPGMLMPLVPPGHVPLAGPPSLQSCTRDVYAPGQCFSPPVALRLLQDLVAAVAHLHAQGVLHGDLYAHNTLWHPHTGHALLSDMGAATVLPGDDGVLSHNLKAVEMRALGIIMSEVLQRVEGGPEAHPATQAAHALAQSCMALQAYSRPTVADVQIDLKCP